MFIYSTDVKGTEKVGSTLVNYYKAIVNGEDTTIGVNVTKDEHDNPANTVAVGLYLNNSYTNEYISKLSTKTDATREATTGAVRVYKQGETLNDLKLKNGILTIKDGATSLVMADEYESWIIKAGTAKVDTLALYSEDTLSTEGVTLGSGDYVVIILDNDNYVTDLYFVDAN